MRRRRIAVVAVASAGAAVIGSACLLTADESKIHRGDDGGLPDREASQPDTSTAVEAGRDGDSDADAAPLGATPGSFVCPGTSETCDQRMITDVHCCVPLTDGGKGRCVASFCNGGDLNAICDDIADCQPGYRCCVNALYGNPECTPTKTCDGVQLCRIHAECPDAGPNSCKTFDCRGRTIGICGEPNQMLEDFCGGAF